MNGEIIHTHEDKQVLRRFAEQVSVAALDLRVSEMHNQSSSPWLRLGRQASHHLLDHLGYWKRYRVD
jgi:hypothetical protein